MDKSKVAILPCNGIGRVVSTIVRQAAYRIAKERPDKVILVSSPALIVDKPDCVEIMKNYPILVIDGCRPRCATKMLELKGYIAKASIYVPDLVAKRRLPLIGERRRELTEKGMKVVEAIVEVALEFIDEIIAGKDTTQLIEKTMQKDLGTEDLISRL